MNLGDYMSELQGILAALPAAPIEAMMDMIRQAWQERRTIFLLGNGGSASTASHFACDLGKNTATPGVPRFRVMAITDNMEVISALGNDLGYENIFAEQLANFLQPDDLVVAISTSGNSPNVLRAVEYARAEGAKTIGWTGRGGGRLAGIVDLLVEVPGDRIEQVENAHLILHHLVTIRMRELSRAAAY
jgi:D-sedoheptulose 7-phosphate isomerase